MLPLEGPQDPHVPLAVREPAGVLLVRDLDELAPDRLRELPREAHARGARDELHRLTGRDMGVRDINRESVRSLAHGNARVHEASDFISRTL